MPCEGCNIQFTVFKRKRQCSECRRNFCNHCLTKRNQNILCERCAIFAKRPLTKSDLLSLKAKDLLYFLHSKHISTAGYVEKEELVNLILSYTGENGDMNNTQTASSVFSSNTIDVDTLGGRSSTTTTNNTTENYTNPFDQWKQTCQNFFTSFTDRISNDLGFDNSRQHPTTSSTPSSSSSSSSSSKLNKILYNVSNDNAAIKITTPTYESMNRISVSISTNTIPTKARNRRKNVPKRTETVTLSTYTNTNRLSSSSPSTSGVFNSVSNSSTISPLISSSSMSSQSISSQITVNNAQQQSSNEHNKSENKVNDFSSLSPSSQFHNSDSQTGFENIADNNSFGDRNIIMINKLALDGNYSGCDCSDDKIITESNTREQKLNINKPSSSSSSLQRGSMVDNCLPTFQSDLIFGNHDAGPSSSVTRSELNSDCSNENNQVRSSGGSSGSSFEELGAVGGGGGTISDNENCQMVQVEIPSIYDYTEIDRNTILPITEENLNPLSFDASNFKNRFIKTEPSCSSNQQNTQQEQINDSQQQKPTRRLIRRQSDSFVSQMEAGPSTSNQRENKLNNNDRSDRKSHKRIKKCCSKCGKSKKNIEGQIEKFKRQLESSVLTQCEIRRNLNSFIHYLEQRAMSIDCSDDSEEIQDNDDIYNGSNDSRNDNGINNDNSRQSNEELQVENNEMDGDDDGEEDNNGQSEPQLLYENENASVDTVQLNLNGSNDGIHVYAQEDQTEQQEKRLQHDSRFINLKNVKTSAELDNLPVKEIKKILALNRVNYSGFFEKRELLERLKLLWNDIRSCPDVDKLPASNICNICMDAPIECVFLECGHMATCLNCGKVLSECPICREYIVRVVRSFKA